MQELMVSRDYGDNIIVKVNNIDVGGKDKVLISGPCSVENYDTMLDIAREMKSLGIDILRGGVFKPRTSPYDFQGIGYNGLQILKDIGKEVCMPVVTEIMDTRDVEKASNYIDIIQVGSRNMYNYNLLKELGHSKMPVILKRGLCSTIKEWLYAAEYIMLHGNENVILCERGIRTFEDFTRNTLDLNAVAVAKQYYRLPVIVDPSHGTGIRALVLPMSIAAIGAGADGLIIESHINPDRAISDSKQTVSVDMLKVILQNVRGN